MGEEKKKLPKKEPIDTGKLAEMLANPDNIKMTYPYEYPKKWGSELWFENNDKYCGKLLTCYKDLWSSDGKFHYHKEKDETFFIIYGTLKLDIEIDGTIRSIMLDPYQHFRVPPGAKHRFKAMSLICHFIEVSTTHRDEDSFRCYYDHKERKWIDV